MDDTSDYAHIFQEAMNLHMAGDLGRARALYTQVILNNPEHLNALVNLGALLTDLGHPAEAIRYLKQAVHLAPDDAEALNNYGNALQKSGQSTEALLQFEAAQKAAPKNAAILNNLSRVLLRRGDFKQSLEVLTKAKTVEPENITLKFIDALALPMISNSMDQLHAARARLDLKLSDLEELGAAELELTDPLSEIGATNFALSYQGQDDRDIQERMARLYLKACPILAYSAPHLQKIRGAGKIKIGFISAHLGSHTIGKLNRALITTLDQDKFDVHVFCPGPDTSGQDDIIDEIANSIGDIYFPLPTLIDTRRCIAEAELDILYYLDIGMEPLTYFLAFSKLARIQCVSVGHPVTTGIPTIDYFISSAFVEPENAGAHYSEKLIQLESFFADYAYPRLPERKKTRQDFGLNAENTLYLCPQSLFKFHPDFDDILKGILSGDAKAKIVLIAGPEPHWSNLLKSRFETSLGGAATRITILPRQSGSDFLELLSLADILLDTPHFSGGNSSYEAFALGKAIVTLPGDFMRSRVTAGLYHLMGIEALIAKDPEDYIKIALKFGNDEKIRLPIEQAILNAHPKIFNTNSAMRAIETFLLDAIDQASQ